MPASRRNSLRRVAIAALVVVVWLGWPVGSLIYRSARQPPRPEPHPVPSVQAPAAPTTLGWTLAQARAAVAADRVARLPGAPAVLDEKRIRAALAHRKARVLALPFAGLDSYKAYDKQVGKLAATRPEHAGKLVVVTGLTVRIEPDGGSVTPSTMSEIRQILTTHEMTEMVLTGIDGKSRNGDGPSRLPDAPSTLVDTVAAGLSAHRVYTAPGLPTVTATARWDDIADGPAVRLATLPPGAPDNLARQLAARFPGDLIVVVRGQWTDLAGPDPRLQSAAVYGYYGQYFEQTAKWGPPAANIGLLVAEYYGKARANAAVVEHPDRAADPLPIVLTWLPWIFAAAVGVLLAGTLAVRWRLVARRRDRRRAETARRAGLQARVAGTGARLVQLSRYVDGDDLLARAAERYRTARDLVAAGG
ncbi:hypothetical protein, partial [Actinocatenispora thailandica]